MDIQSHPNFQPFVDPASKDENTHFPLDGQDLRTVSDETLIALYDTAPVLHHLGGTKIVRLSRTLVLKGGGSVLPCEAANMNFAAEHTRILLPRVHRVLNIKEDDGYWGTPCFIVMDFVKGACVADCWTNLDKASRSSITSQVAEMIQEMHSITLAKPGPIGGGSRFQGVWFSDFGAGPFDTLQDMTKWFNHKLEICNQYRQSLEGTPKFAFQKLVLTHQGIAPRNLILDENGRVWLIDWAYAGAYPPGFERAALLVRWRFSDFSTEVCQKVDDYPVEAMQLRSIMYGLISAPFA